MRERVGEKDGDKTLSDVCLVIHYQANTHISTYAAYSHSLFESRGEIRLRGERLSLNATSYIGWGGGGMCEPQFSVTPKSRGV